MSSDGTLSPGDDVPIDSGVPVCEQLGLTAPEQMARTALSRARATARARGYRPGQQGRPSRSALAAAATARVGGAGAHPRDPQTVASTLAVLLRDRGWTQDVSIGGVVGRWRDVVGDQLADHCEPETFENGILTVRTDSTAWAQQLKALSSQLVQRLAVDVGEGVVREVRVLGPAGPGFKKGRRTVQGRGPRDTWG